MSQNNNILSLVNISKSYPGVKALDHVNIDFRKGEVHALVGENGAGKSTLIKTMTGAITVDEGEIIVNGKSYKSYLPHEALFNLGITAIYQEFNLISSLSISDNIYLGKEIRKNGLINNKEMHKATREILKSIGFNLSPSRMVSELSVAEQQIVEIAKALSYDVKILIMDEPTAPLMPAEVSQLFQLIEQLKNRGVTIVYISHRLEEALSISDRITVLRDGQFIQTLQTTGTTRKELISLMVGRTLGQEYPSRECPSGNVMLSLHNVTTEFVKDISFDLCKGEIFGIAGLVGSGRTEVAKAIFGLDKVESGEIVLNDKKVKICSPTDAMRSKIGLIPEDRKKLGILGKMSVKHNVSFSILQKISRFFLIKNNQEDEIVEDYIGRLKIKTPDKNQQVQFLSGGNQQKAIISKMLASDCDVLIFDEPTRGVDVGAKQEIYAIMNQLSQSGKSIIMISSDLPEVINMADRIMVMNTGRVQGFVDKAHATQDYILDLASCER